MREDKIKTGDEYCLRDEKGEIIRVDNDVKIVIFSPGFFKLFGDPDDYRRYFG